MAVATGGNLLPSKIHNLPKIKSSAASPPPLLVSTNPSHVNQYELRELYGVCNHSCHRFPTAEPVDALKLRTAVSHSSVVVSVFTKPDFVSSPTGGDWIRKVAPLTPQNGRLIGFGRAVSDLGLTASIYDVMVHPDLRGRGIGRMIVARIIRMLINRDIYDIAALCNDEERQFFRACGFENDRLESTTMMYARSLSSDSEDEQTISAETQEMGKIQVEVCLISARGLRRTSTFWKLQWFAVGWIDPESKYCTKIDASGNVNPVWKTRFSTMIDPSEAKSQESALHVEVYSREPFFLRESLLGSVTIALKEFLEKFNSNCDVPKPVEEVGSFQLRKNNSNKPLGFVDVSIRVSEDAAASSYLDSNEGFNLTDNNGDVNLGASGHRSLQPESSYRMPFPPNHSHHHPVRGANYPAAGGLSYQPPQAPASPSPPPPPPPSNVGYVPNFFPMTSSYINMPSSAAPPGRGVGPGFGMGVGAGALAAGAVFGDDFMSVFDVPSAS